MPNTLDFGFKPKNFFGAPDKIQGKKRQLTHVEKLYAWEHFSHTCNICGNEVAKQSDADYDHARAFSKGGSTNLANVKIVHKDCHKIKGTKSLSATKKYLGIKYETKKRTSIKKNTTKEKPLIEVKPIPFPKFKF